MSFIAKQSVFRGDDRGNTAILFALSLIPLMGLVGASVDGLRWFNANRATSAAIDAAVLSGARAMQLAPDDEAGALQNASRVYSTNTASRTPVERDTVAFLSSDAKSAVTVSGNAFLKTTFLALLGIKELPLVLQAAARAPKAVFASGLNQANNVEVALMLDLTGSMCDNGTGPCTTGTKLDGLRLAAKDFINIVVKDTQSPYTSRVSLVPFSTRIRVDVDNHDGVLMKKLTNLNFKWSGWFSQCTEGGNTGPGGETSGGWTCTKIEKQYKTDWRTMPCVTERAYGTGAYRDSTMSYTDDAPGADKWLNAHGGNRSVVALDSSDTAVQPASDNGTTAATATANWNYAPERTGCEDVSEDNRIAALSSDKVALSKRIEKFSAAGATNGTAGVAWAWYMLSPKWKDIWTGDAAPGSYSDTTTRQSNGAMTLRKVAVLMTDGVFNTIRGSKDESTTVIAGHVKKLCTEMKAQNIEIYSVGFALDALGAVDRVVAEDVLKSCGTDLAHFYSSLNVAQLQQTFRDIALKVTPIRLTQ